MHFTDSVLFPSQGPSKCARRHPTATRAAAWLSTPCPSRPTGLRLWVREAALAGRTRPAASPSRPPTLAAHHPLVGRGPALPPPTHPRPSLATRFQRQLPGTLPPPRALPVPARPPPHGSTGDGEGARQGVLGGGTEAEGAGSPRSLGAGASETAEIRAPPERQKLGSRRWGGHKKGGVRESPTGGVGGRPGGRGRGFPAGSRGEGSRQRAGSGGAEEGGDAPRRCPRPRPRSPGTGEPRPGRPGPRGRGPRLGPRGGGGGRGAGRTRLTSDPGLAGAEPAAPPSLRASPRPGASGFRVPVHLRDPHFRSCAAPRRGGASPAGEPGEGPRPPGRRAGGGRPPPPPQPPPPPPPPPPPSSPGVRRSWGAAPARPPRGAAPSPDLRGPPLTQILPRKPLGRPETSRKPCEKVPGRPRHAPSFTSCRRGQWAHYPVSPSRGQFQDPGAPNTEPGTRGIGSDPGATLREQDRPGQGRGNRVAACGLCPR